MRADQPSHYESGELVRRAQDGDSVALNSLVDRHSDRLLARIRLMMGPGARRAAESTDFLQAVFVDAVQGLRRKQVREERSFQRWLVAIARNKIQSSLRRRRERAFESLSASCHDVRDETPGPASEADLSESAHRLIEGIEQLGSDHRRVIELRALDGLRFREVGDRMERTEAAARMLFHRAMTELGGHL